MRSFLRSVGRGKRVRKRLGTVRVVERADFDEMELDARVAMIQSLVPLALMHVQDVLMKDVEALAGGRYSRDPATGYRAGSNPGTVRLAGQRVPIRVPRVRGEAGELPLPSYQALKGRGVVDDGLLRRVLYGVSCRNYEAAAEVIPGALGLSSSSVSRSFVEASSAKLKEFQDRDLSKENIVAIFLDGKSFSDEMMVLALGVSITGEKRILGFVETDTENEKVLTPFLQSLLERGMDISEGLLVILDGGKGLRAAVKRAFGSKAAVQRCQWHKRENVVSHLPRAEQAMWRKRLQRAYDRPTYKEARAALMLIYRELELKNQSAAASLLEGLEETLTLHRLGVFALLGRSFKTTNCLESVNSQIEERCAKVDCWKNSSQRQRWLATSLMDIEPRLRKAMGYQHMDKLRGALQKDLKLGGKSQEKAA